MTAYFNLRVHESWGPIFDGELELEYRDVMDLLKREYSTFTQFNFRCSLNSKTGTKDVLLPKLFHVLNPFRLDLNMIKLIVITESIPLDKAYDGLPFHYTDPTIEYDQNEDSLMVFNKYLAAEGLILTDKSWKDFYRAGILFIPAYFTRDSNDKRKHEEIWDSFILLLYQKLFEHKPKICICTTGPKSDWAVRLHMKQENIFKSLSLNLKTQKYVTTDMINKESTFSKIKEYINRINPPFNYV